MAKPTCDDYDRRSGRFLEPRRLGVWQWVSVPGRKDRNARALFLSPRVYFLVVYDEESDRWEAQAWDTSSLPSDFRRTLAGAHPDRFQTTTWHVRDEPVDIYRSSRPQDCYAWIAARVATAFVTIMFERKGD